MAVKKRKLVPDNQFDLATLAAYIQSMNDQHNRLPPKNEMIREAEDIVRCLARTSIGEYDETTWQQLLSVEEFLLRMVSSVHGDLRKDIISAVLGKFYSIISDPQSDASPVTAVVLIVFIAGGSSMRLAARWLMSQGEPGGGGPRCAGIRASLSCLYRWAGHGRWPVLGQWTMSFINALEELEQFDILVEVSTQHMACLLLALDPHLNVKESVAEVVFHVMASLRDSIDAFDRMAPHVSMVLEKLASDSGQRSRQLLQNVVDILTTSVELHMGPPGTKTHAEFKLKYAQLMRCLERHMPSRGCTYIVAPTWKRNTVASARALAGASAASVASVAPPTRKNGLFNLGNTCYMNSVMQALLVTRPFSTHVMLHMSDVPYWSKIGNLFAKMTYAMTSKLKAEELFQIIRPPFFSSRGQNQSFEFLGYLFEVLHAHEHQSERNFDYSRPPTNQARPRAIVEPPSTETDVNGNCSSSACDSASGSGSGSGSSAGHSSALARPGTSNRRSASPRPSGSGGSSSPKRSTDYVPPRLRSSRKRVRVNNPFFALPRDSFIDNTFGGVLLTRIECKECHMSSLSRDMFRDLQLAFPEKIEGELSVQALLDYFCSSERLSGDNMYQCPECRVLREAERSVIVESAPKYLILVLKYFRFESKLQVQNKLMISMQYDCSITLPKLRPQDEQLIYHLSATVIHSGTTLDSGHYYTLAKDGDQWYEFNDDVITLTDISELDMLSNSVSPYILFYRRSDVEEIAAPAYADLPARSRQVVDRLNQQVIHCNKSAELVRSGARP